VIRSFLFLYENLGAFLSTKYSGFNFQKFMQAKRKFENFLLMLANEIAFPNGSTIAYPEVSVPRYFLPEFTEL